MKKFGFLAFVLIVQALYAGPPQLLRADPPEEVTDAIEKQLAIKRAIAEAEYCLFQSDNSERAVQVLEGHLHLIDGDRYYLKLLRDAYRKYVVHLQFEGQSTLLEKYLRRLRILDPSAAQELAKTPVSVAVIPNNAAEAAITPEEIPLEVVEEPLPSPPTSKPTPKQPVLAEMAASFENDNQKPKFRGKLNTDEASKTDPFSLENALATSARADSSPPQSRSQLLARGQSEFDAKRYEQASILFAKAHQTDNSLPAAVRDQWAYCKFKKVVDLLNDSLSKPVPWNLLEQEVKSALALEPNAKLTGTGRWLLQQITQRQSAGGKKESGEQRVEVKHYPKNAQGWKIAETKYFRIFHNQNRRFVEEAACVTELTRSKMSRKWFGADAAPWRNKCDIYLHATAQDYSRRTGVHPKSPGHSRIESAGKTGKIISRQIDLRCDNPDLLSAILPHETTHVVLAGQFGSHDVPRWVDEGVAVLTEPEHKIQLHLKNLNQFHSEQELFHVRELMELKDYPHPRRIGPFYAQSVSLVQYLTAQRGPLVFSRFVIDGLSHGYQSALQKHYGIQSFGELQQRWTNYMLSQQTPQAEGIAQR